MLTTVISSSSLMPMIDTSANSLPSKEPHPPDNPAVTANYRPIDIIPLSDNFLSDQPSRHQRSTSHTSSDLNSLCEQMNDQLDMANVIAGPSNISTDMGQSLDVPRFPGQTMDNWDTTIKPSIGVTFEGMD